jgi:hypothetical protein
MGFFLGRITFVCLGSGNGDDDDDDDADESCDIGVAAAHVTQL